MVNFAINLNRREANNHYLVYHKPSGITIPFQYQIILVFKGMKY